jgi:trigger factor
LSTQIEHLENHTARLTVEVTPERVDKHMRDAARRISREVNIPGFRKGKAPYNVILQRVGAQNLLSEALDTLGNEVFREALDEAKIEPYAPGSLENVETEPSMKLTFVVPKQPEVDLAAYRDIRLPFEAPEVEDSAVTDAMKALQEQRALVETVQRPAQMGDQVKLHIKGERIHPADETPHDAAESSAGEEHAEHDHEHDHEEHEEHGHTDEFIDDELTIVLTEDKDEEEIVPGFSAEIVGLNAEGKKSFSISFPDDYEDKRLARHSFNFEVEAKEVQSRTLPALNDDFAKQATNDEVDNLLDLRIRMRKNLQDMATREAESKYIDQVLDKVVEQATVKFPDEMADEYVDDIIQNLDRSLRERGLSLDDYKRIENKTDEALRADYRDTAIKRLKNTLVLGKVVEQERLSVSDADVEEQIDKMSQQFGEQAQVFRKMLARAENRRSIAVDLITSKALRRLLEIGKGENPEIAAPSVEAVQTEPETPAATASASDSLAESTEVKSEVAEASVETSEALSSGETSQETPAPTANAE